MVSVRFVVKSFGGERTSSVEVVLCFGVFVFFVCLCTADVFPGENLCWGLTLDRSVLDLVHGGRLASRVFSSVSPVIAVMSTDLSVPGTWGPSEWT